MPLSVMPVAGCWQFNGINEPVFWGVFVLSDLVSFLLAFADFGRKLMAFSCFLVTFCLFLLDFWRAFLGHFLILGDRSVVCS